MTVELVIGERPVPASRPRVSRWGTYYTKSHQAYNQVLHDFFEDEGAPSFRLSEEAKYYVEVEFVFPLLKTSKKTTPLGDLDNLWKMPIDAMTKAGKYWHDDRQIVVTKITKRFALPGEEPHTRLLLKEHR